MGSMALLCGAEGVFEFGDPRRQRRDRPASLVGVLTCLTLARGELADGVLRRGGGEGFGRGWLGFGGVGPRKLYDDVGVEAQRLVACEREVSDGLLGAVDKGRVDRHGGLVRAAESGDGQACERRGTEHLHDLEVCANRIEKLQIIDGNGAARGCDRGESTRSEHPLGQMDCSLGIEHTALRKLGKIRDDDRVERREPELRVPFEQGMAHVARSSAGARNGCGSAARVRVEHVNASAGRFGELFGKWRGAVTENRDAFSVDVFAEVSSEHGGEFGKEGRRSGCDHGALAVVRFRHRQERR